MNDNNFEPEIQSQQPFAGRQDIFARIQQYLIDPSDRHALLIIGRDGMGKSRILQQCLHVLEDNVIPCYIPLTDVDYRDDDTWLYHLIEQTNIALSSGDFTISRLPQLAESNGTLREWFTGEYLPEVTKLIRSHRRLVWLMDDVEYLLAAIDAGKLPDDTLVFLYDVLQTNLQFGLVFTLDEDNEAQASQLAPLVDESLFQRLHPLSSEETTTLLEKYSLTLEDSAKSYIYTLTDGHPLIIQHMGEALQSASHMTITKSEIDAILKTVYQKSHSTYRHIWQNSLSQNERLVLTAISGILYDDPIAKLNAKRIESWLLETDYPLDMTAVNAGIRGLDYRDLVGGSVDNLKIRAQLFERWLIEHARMDEVNPVVAKSNALDDSLPISRNGLLLIVGIAIFIIVMVALLQQSNQSVTTTVQPTVTLEQ